MSILSSFINWFKKRKDNTITKELVVIEEKHVLSSPFFTFYNVGPDMLTYQYPVDTAVYKEIIDEDGLIGPEKFAAFPGSIEAMKENDNFWFHSDEHKEARILLVKDLLSLARKHEKIGAYSLLASISSYDDAKKYREKGIALGCPKCMVAQAITLYSNGRTQDGFELLKRGADLGDKTGCFMVAISYQFGTISEMDINKACEYYFKALGGDEDFYIYLNLGCILVEGGYCHTAIHFFKKMYEISKRDVENLREYGRIDNMVQNLETCLELVKIPYTERAKRVKIQVHSRRLTRIFCYHQKSPEPFVPEHIAYSIKGFCPSTELFDIDLMDLKEREALETLTIKKTVDKYEDYLFLTIPITINNPRIHGTQREILFLEKCCHAALNSYIQSNLIPLRAMFKSMGFIFIYLPSHMDDYEDFADRIGSYHNDYGKRMWKHDWSFEQMNPDFKAQEYWQTMIPSEELPDDCAGFLMYKPNLVDLEDHSNYEYILFPYRPGTDWARAFRELFEILRDKPIVSIYDKEKPIALPSSGNFLCVSSSYNFTYMDNCDSILAEIKMPTLSKVLYLALLNHPEGISIKCMIDYKDELWEYYKNIIGSKAKMENIDTLCDPTNNSINEKLSRIKSAFTTAMKEKYAEDMKSFIPMGKRGEAIRVSVDRDRVKYEQKEDDLE